MDYVANQFNPEKWHKVNEIELISRWSLDTIRRWVYRGDLKAFIAPKLIGRNKRIWRGIRILGAELIRFFSGNNGKKSVIRVGVIPPFLFRQPQ